jgi:hypothetical protein
MIVLTLFGNLTMILLIAGVAFIAWFEWRIVGASFDVKKWLLPEPAEVSRRSSLLARAQTDRPA